jgi:uncharacterized membrane protein YagU involved in acid resistance
MIVFADLWSRVSGLPRTKLGTREEMEAAGKVVDIVTRRVLHAGVKKRQKQQLTLGFHYAFGMLLGGAYGALTEAVPEAASGAGVAFGALEWAIGNRVAAPQFGLLRQRGSYSKQEQLQTFAAHVVFGTSTELARRALRRLLRQEPDKALPASRKAYHQF